MGGHTLLIYYVLLLTAVVGGIVLTRWKAGKLLYVLGMGGALFAVAAIRRSTGYDYNLYGTLYNDLMLRDLGGLATDKVEKGFAIPFKLLSRVFYDYQAMFVVIAFIITALLMLQIYRHSSNVWVSVAAFLTFGIYFNSMNFMRQMIAAIVVLYALRYIASRQFLRFLALVLLASTIHFSALLMLPFFFILQIRMNYLVLGLYAACGIALYINSTAIMQLVTKYVYKGYDPTANVEMTMGLPIGYVIGFAAFFLLAFLLRKDLVRRNAFNSILINCAFFTMFFEFFGTKHTIISRFAILFYLAPVLLLTPDLLAVLLKKVQDFEKKRSLRLVACACVYVMTSIAGLSLFQYFLAHNYNGVVPYKTIFSDKSTARQGGAEGGVG